MSNAPPSTVDKEFLKRVMETTIRVGIVVLLAVWCFQIVRPFIIPFVWGVIIAIATQPAYLWLEAMLGNRRGVAATILVLLMFVLLVGPILMLAGTLVDGVQFLARDLSDGTLTIPPPPDSVGGWPIIGESLQTFWALASANLQEALRQIAPQLRAAGLWLLSGAAGAGLGILEFALAVIVAGVLLAHTEGSRRVASALATRLAGGRGAEFADLAQATVWSVATGILGIALVQSILAGLGFLAVGIPAAGFLALLCLFLAVIQIGPSLILIGAVIYIFTTADTVTAVVFLVWSVFVGVIDNVLKPLLLGRGMKLPMVVIFVGAIGGFLASGIIGLFIGAVVLALGYTLFVAWLKQETQSADEPSG